MLNILKVFQSGAVRLQSQWEFPDVSMITSEKAHTK